MGEEQASERASERFQVLEYYWLRILTGEKQTKTEEKERNKKRYINE